MIFPSALHEVYIGIVSSGCMGTVTWNKRDIQGKSQTAPMSLFVQRHCDHAESTHR